MQQNFGKKVKFSETNDLSATSDLAHVLAKYDMGLCAKFCHHMLCHFGMIGAGKYIINVKILDLPVKFYVL